MFLTIGVVGDFALQFVAVNVVDCDENVCLPCLGSESNLRLKREGLPGRVKLDVEFSGMTMEFEIEEDFSVDSGLGGVNLEAEHICWIGLEKKITESIIY